MGLTATTPLDQANEQLIGPANNVNEAELSATLEQRGFLTTSVDNLVNWARTGSMWPMTFGLA